MPLVAGLGNHVVQHLLKVHPGRSLDITRLKQEKKRDRKEERDQALSTRSSCCRCCFLSGRLGTFF